jgi:hypothetical protein
LRLMIFIVFLATDIQVIPLRCTSLIV